MGKGREDFKKGRERKGKIKMERKLRKWKGK